MNKTDTKVAGAYVEALAARFNTPADTFYITTGDDWGAEYRIIIIWESGFEWPFTVGDVTPAPGYRAEPINHYAMGLYRDGK